MTKDEREMVAAEMLARARWWGNALVGEPEPRNGKLMWRVFNAIHPPPRELHRCDEWSMLWAVTAEAVRIGAIP